MQHDGLSWIVSRDQFEDAELSDIGQFLDRTLDEWIGGLNNQERQSLTDSIFMLLSSTGVDSLYKMSHQKLKSVMSVLSALSRLPKDRQTELLKLGGNLIQSGGQNAWSRISDMITNQADRPS